MGVGSSFVRSLVGSGADADWVSEADDEAVRKRLLALKTETMSNLVPTPTGPSDTWARPTEHVTDGDVGVTNKYSRSHIAMKTDLL